MNQERLVEFDISRTKPIFVVSAACCDQNHSASHFEECTFRVGWKINAHMRPGSADPDKAVDQHEEFRRVLREQGSTLIKVPFVHGCYDSVFVKDSAVLAASQGQHLALLAKPYFREREREQEFRANHLSEAGFQIVDASTYHLEGGDVVTGGSLPEAFLGFGFRSDEAAARDLSIFLRKPVIPLELTDPYFYHLDTALAILQDGTALAYKDAFSPSSWDRLENSKSIRTLIPVSREDAMCFGLNIVEVGDTVVFGREAPEVMTVLRAMGKNTRTALLSEFQLAGGSAACLTAPVHYLN